MSETTCFPPDTVGFLADTVGFPGAEQQLPWCFRRLPSGPLPFDSLVAAAACMLIRLVALYEQRASAIKAIGSAMRTIGILSRQVELLRPHLHAHKVAPKV